MFPNFDISHKFVYVSSTLSSTVKELFKEMSVVRVAYERYGHLNIHCHVHQLILIIDKYL